MADQRQQPQQQPEPPKIQEWQNKSKKKVDPATEEYFKNMFKLLQEDCYVLRKPTGCHELAEFFQVVEKDYKAANTLYESTCMKMNNPRSCFNFATALAFGLGLTANEAKALEVFKRSCDLGGPDGCNNAGIMLQTGVGAARDLDAAAELFKKGCNSLLYGNACQNLSTFYLTGGAKVDGNRKVVDPSPETEKRKDMLLALEYAVKACNMGNLYGCVNASRMYSLGDGVPKDDAKAEHFKKLAEEAYQAQTTTIEMRARK